MKAEMIEGTLRPQFWLEENDNLWEEIVLVLDKFYHTDTYYKPVSKDNLMAHWRVQGYIYLTDLPDIIPLELKHADSTIRIREGKLVIEVWCMIVKVNIN